MSFQGGRRERPPFLPEKSEIVKNDEYRRRKERKN